MALLRVVTKFGLACLPMLMAGGGVFAGEANGPPPKPEAAGLLIGWASADLTPDRPVSIQGQMYARVSEGVQDPITVTALALEARPRGGGTGDRAVMVSCDLISIPDELRDAVRKRLKEQVPDLDPLKVFISATHTHTAPEVRPDRWEGLGVDLGVMPASEYLAMAAEKIADAVARAWRARSPGGFSFGLGHAVVGRNRLVTAIDGRSVMYGKTGDRDFSHMESYEDHSVNLLATWDPGRRLTGLVVNLACPSQVSEGEYRLSADYWHETRVELRRRFGADLFVLPQCSAAGDQSPRPLVGKVAEERMWKLAGVSQRQAIAVRIADAVTAAMPVLRQVVETAPVLAHRVEILELPRRKLDEEDVRKAAAEAAGRRADFEKAKAKLDADPSQRKKPRWYAGITAAYRRAEWCDNVARCHELQQRQPRVPVEVHVLRLGDVAFASNPFEYYLDYGCRIKARSKAVQTFVVQLAGGGTYLPTERAVAGGAYGSVPASTTVGPDGGRELAERTVELINGLWERR